MRIGKHEVTYDADLVERVQAYRDKHPGLHWMEAAEMMLDGKSKPAAKKAATKKAAAPAVKKAAAKKAPGKKAIVKSKKR